MDFRKIYQDARMSAGFGQQRLYLRTRDRIRASLSAVGPSGTELKINRGLRAKYSDGARYVIASGMTYDLLVSLYDVNSSSAIILRMSAPSDVRALAATRRRLSGMKGPGLEMRAAGLQSGDPTLCESLAAIQRLADCSLVEADLFGLNIRHLVFDLKTGMLMDLLPQNMILGPDELVNRATQEDFGRLRARLQFV